MNGDKMSRFLVLTLAAGVLTATTKKRVRGEVTSIGGEKATWRRHG
jgi:hypothetical protein